MRYIKTCCTQHFADDERAPTAIIPTKTVGRTRPATSGRRLAASVQWSRIHLGCPIVAAYDALDFHQSVRLSAEQPDGLVKIKRIVCSYNRTSQVNPAPLNGGR
eukprot:Selendium_serpulae@DN3916_c0_g1_i6.p2